MPFITTEPDTDLPAQATQNYGLNLVFYLFVDCFNSIYLTFGVTSNCSAFILSFMLCFA